MSKEILIYGSLNSYSSSEFIKSVDEGTDSDIVVRINSEGGSPEYGWGMVAKFQEHKGNKLIKVDGQAHSMCMFFLCYATKVEALDVAEFVVHRAAYASWYENSPEYFTEAIRGNLERVNSSLRKALEAKIDVKKFEELKGVKMKDIFSMDSRIDVFLTAAEAKKIGLIDTIVKITPEKRSEIETLLYKAASYTGLNHKKVEIKTTNIMTIEQLKREHPELVASLQKETLEAERDRVGACLVYLDVDSKAVKLAIESGKPLSHTQMAEFSLKLANANTLKKVESDAPETVKTAEVKPEGTEKEKKVSDFETSVDSVLGLKK
jgi:ATP-dependent protease ClpP protease subunit